MIKYFCTICLICVVCMSCNNDDNDTSVSQEEEEVEMEDVGFYNLHVGNVWTYEYFSREQLNDESSNFSTTGTIEEREIIAETVVEGEMIYTFQVTTTGADNSPFNDFDEGVTTYQVKDSLGYLVRLNSRLIFSNQNDDEYLRSSESFGDIFGVLLALPQTIEVSAGIFDCSVNEVSARLNPDGEIAPGREMSFFAEEIGEVLYEYSFVSQGFHVAERRLISFDFPE